MPGKTSRPWPATSSSAGSRMPSRTGPESAAFGGRRRSWRKASAGPAAGRGASTATAPAGSVPRRTFHRLSRGPAVRLLRRSSRQGLALTITGALAALLPTRRLVAHHQLASRAWSSAASCATTSRRETCSPSDCGSGHGSSRVAAIGPGPVRSRSMPSSLSRSRRSPPRTSDEPASLSARRLRQRAAYAGPIVEDTLVPVGSTPLFTPARRF
jgi:hypothetical protein